MVLNLLLAGVMTSAVAAEPVVVLDRSLNTTTGPLVSLRDGVAVVNVAGKQTTVTGVAAVVNAAGWGPERSWPGLPKAETAEVDGGSVHVELTDGSRLRGSLLAGKGDGLVLVHKQLGKVDFPLDSLRTLTLSDFGEYTAGKDDAKGDSVRLLNGDRIEGFIESIGSPKEGESGTGLAVTIEREKVKTVVPLERVASVRVQSGGAQKAEKAVWFSSGEKSAATEFSIDSSQARLVRTKGSLAANLKAASVEGAMLEPRAIMPLSVFAVRSGAGSVELGTEQTLGTRDVTIPEPRTIEWTLPAGAKRITGWAVMPEECRQLGDCTVKIAATPAGQSTATPLVEFTLNAASPVVKLDHELPASISKLGGVLSVVVGEGKNGPVQDRVVLRRVLIGAASETASKQP